jgi:dTDP-glucose pyrophosphorylase
MPPGIQASQHQTSRQRNDWPTRAIILAAGRGRRLVPLTDSRPKPLLKIEGKPMLASILEALNAASVATACIVIHHLAEQIITFAGDGRKWDIRLQYRRQYALLGTADGLSAASTFLTEPTFVLAADYALPKDHLKRLKHSYQKSDADIFASLKEMTREEVAQRNCFRFDDRGRIVGIVEKPSQGAVLGNLGASLIYIVPPQIAAFLPRVKRSLRGEYELTDALNLMLDEGYTMDGIIQQPPREWQPPVAGS